MAQLRATVPGTSNISVGSYDVKVSNDKVDLAGIPADEQATVEAELLASGLAEASSAPAPAPSTSDSGSNE